MRYQFRLTKYDPSLRDPGGAYLREEWTSFSDVGHTFGGVRFDQDDYLRVEKAYLSALESLIREAGLKGLELRELESASKKPLPSFIVSGRILSIAECIKFAKLALREQLWGKLVLPGIAYVHFGWDFYVYVGLPKCRSETVERIQSTGLFVEHFRSPYLRARRAH
jgi:hypothetical protein